MSSSRAATIVGQCSTTLDEYVDNLQYSTTSAGTVCHAQSLGAAGAQLTIIKFTLPESATPPESLKIALSCSAYAPVRVCAALCTSDDNYNAYFNTSSPIDGTRIVFFDLGSIKSNSTFTVSTSKFYNLIANQEYFLILWTPSASDMAYSLTINPSTQHSITVNYVTSAVCIKEESSYGVYQCYIDTEYAEYGATETDCTIIGQDDVTYSNSGQWLDTLSYLYNLGGVVCVSSAPTGTTLGQSIMYWLKFTTPEFDGASQKITFNLELYRGNLSSTLNCAICTSDANYKNYLQGVYPVDDQYQIVSITPTIEVMTDTTVGYRYFTTIEINTNKLRPNTVYYLVLWPNNDSNSYTFVGDCSGHTITLASDDMENLIDSGSRYERYTPYIDNGTSWEEL